MTTTHETAESVSRLTTQELHLISAWGETRFFPGDASVAAEGGRCDSLYFIAEGRVKLFTVDPAGLEALISIQGAGEYF
ncbi:MAG: cyclic nucleotide-binding domain-containing protein, partial [Desulfobacterales bacterium]